MTDRIESMMQEGRTISPSDTFKQNAKLKSEAEYEKLYRQSLDDPETFWGDVANELHWFQPWDTVTEWNEPFVKWFVGGKTNIAYNCLDFQIEQGRGDKQALLLGGRTGRQTHLHLPRTAHGSVQIRQRLKRSGRQKG